MNSIGTLSIKTMQSSGEKSKRYLTPVRRIGLSRKHKSDFKSPMIHGNVALDHNNQPILTSKNINSPVAVTVDTPTVSSRTKKLKTVQKDIEVKDKLIINQNVSNSSTPLNKHDNNIVNKSDKNEQSKEKQKSIKRSKRKLIIDDTNSDEEIEPNILQDISGCEVIKLETDIVKENEFEDNMEDVKLTKLQNKLVIKISPLSPKTVQNHIEDNNIKETKNLKRSKENKTSNKSKKEEKRTKSSFDEYIKRKERRIKENTLQQKLSLKGSQSSHSEQCSSDDEFLSTKKDKLKVREEPSKKQDGDIANDERQKFTTDKFSLIHKIITLEKDIKSKEMELEKVQHAKIYKKIHNVKELNNLKNLWKSGCENALQDLLNKLQQHSDIDMLTLMKKLNAPEYLIKYDTENDCFL